LIARCWKLIQLSSSHEASLKKQRLSDDAIDE
jgi:hypothetical protein